MRSIKLFLILALAGRAFAVLPAGVQWDIRTTGSDVNGGGFVAGASGTDFSQQNTAHTAFTDLVVGATTTQVTSVAHPFGATDVGNLIQSISGAGCTVGFFQVVSVSVITATLDRSAGTAASVCTANLGGSLLTITKGLASMVDSNTLWIQTGTYTQVASLTTKAITVIATGYNATHGDNGTKPLITTATNTTPLFRITGAGSSVFLHNLSYSNTAAVRSTGLTVITGAAGPIFNTNTIWDGFSIGLSFDLRAPANWDSAVEVKNSTGAGVTVSNTQFQCIGCYIHNNAGAGVSSTVGSPVTITLVNTIVAANGARGVDASGGIDWVNLQSCDIVGNTGAGVFLLNNMGLNIYNSILYGNTTYGIDNSGGNVTVYEQNNAYGANGTAPVNNVPLGPGDVTLAANPFTSGTNFALNSTAGGGAALKGVGFPKIFIGGTTTSAIDVGAVQSAASTPGVVSSGFVQ